MCTSGVGPLSTYGELYGHRWGTNAPQLSQLTSVTLLSDDGASDPVTAAPTFIGKGSLSISGTLIQLGTATIGTFSQRNRTAGTTNKITAQGQSGSFWTTYVHALVNDVSAGAWFWIDQDLGDAQAQITEPLASAVVSAVSLYGINAPSYVTIANGDSLVMYRPSKINIASLSSRTQYNILQVQNADIISTETPEFSVTYVTDYVIFAQVMEESFLLEHQTEQGIINAANCYFDSAPNVNFITAGGAISEPSTYSAAVGVDWSRITVLDGDVLLEGTGGMHMGRVAFGRAYLNVPLAFDQGHVEMMLAERDQLGWLYADSELWGPGNLELTDGATMYIYDNTSAELLLTGTLSIDGQSTAFPWVAASHAWGAATSINPTAIDTNGGLWNPNTGTAFIKP